MSGVRCMLMRGGTSKGAYFLGADLPADPAERDGLLLRLMGTPDPRQIDGLGGAHPLTSKVAVVWPGGGPDRDVDYLFLQVGVGEPTVSDRQTCGNLLAGVGQFAVERGLVAAGPERTSVRIRLVNTGATAVSSFPTPGGEVAYAGPAAISGVPGTAAPVELAFAGTEGSVCGSLLPTGRVRDTVEGIEVTCVDNGMPVVVAAAADLGLTGYEPVAELAAHADLARRVQALRTAAGRLMGLGEVAGTPVPKTTLVAPPREGGALCTRTFIPLRPHHSIGVLGAVSVATAALLDGAVGHDVLVRPPAGAPLEIEHPSGRLAVAVEFGDPEGPARPADPRTGGPGDPGGRGGPAVPRVRSSTVIRTARKLFDGTAFPRS
ncbi:4-oxalomesaconate tautomerase [Streptomyces hoynatensis]|uniref:4-oxalomesaconate tautomerase n=1 Tax=Streptomyces hoynatensis TaxID=1141874 RepID=A0A3A9Z9C1_9ACTN|nr:4-oxalomesaconate tautomerase [Streptomyces hoynatensis]RKN44729.1 4-oxalomesaconate tautomerase [Streptomyces hoynatensis]